MAARLTALLLLLVPVMGLGTPLQKLILVVENTTTHTLTYRDIYAPNEPPNIIKKVTVTPALLAPHHQAKITILFSGSAGIAASASFTDNNLDSFTFGFNDPEKIYPGGSTYFETTNTKFSTQI